VLRELTAGIRDVDIPVAGPVSDVWDAEIYAYHKEWITQSPELYQGPTRALIQAAGRTDPAVYAQARHHVEVLRRNIQNVFREVDLLITPTQRTLPVRSRRQPAPNAGPGATPAAGGGPLNNTAAFNIYGLPAVSVPCGFTADGLPIGLQISGPPFAESAVMTLAHAYEQATEWHRRRPNLIARPVG
jgi:aspartyl-tRNA(Asn)/glutamyl-tRNA(Gln) amidotransferase subunit A